MKNNLRKATDIICSDKNFAARQYTNWENPGDVFQSGYGRVTFLNWSVMEKERIEGRGGKVTIWKHPTKNMVCLTLDHEFIMVTGVAPHYGYKRLKAASW